MTLKSIVAALFIIVFTGLSACGQKVLFSNEGAISSIALYQVIPGRPESQTYYELSLEVNSSSRLSQCEQLALELPSKEHVYFVNNGHHYRLRMPQLPSSTELTVFCSNAPSVQIKIVVPDPILRIQQ